MNGSNEAHTREIIGLFLRLSIGILFFLTGLNKFLGGLQFFAHTYIVHQFAETWIPSFLLYPFGYLLPFVELICGFLVILGLFTRRALIVLGVVLLMLEFGQVVLAKVNAESYATVAQIANYILILGATLWCVRENPYSVDALRRGA
jgi:uncharacterized membrane protein YphA (DoxX/SURF4 family)